MKRLKEVEKKEQEFLEGSRDKVMFENVTSTDTEPSTPTDKFTTTDTYMVPSTDTLLDIEPDETMVRTTCYLTKIQSDYVKKMAKKHKCKESAIIRKSLELLMKQLK